MFNFNESITTIERAKTFFRAMECNSYHMAREFSARYDEYKALGISKETERAWIQERFHEYHAGLVSGQGFKEPWHKYHRMYELFEVLKTPEGLRKMLMAAEAMRDYIPMNERSMIAETIHGVASRVARSGMIYKSYDMGDIPAAQSFAELCLYFATYEGTDDRHRNRAKKAFDLCNEIKRELGLDI